MSKLGTYSALNRLLTVLYRSLPMYLTFACPWSQRADAKALAVVGRIVDDQKQLSNRVAKLIMAEYGPVDMGEYPLDFPDTHDLSIDYLVGKLVACQKYDIERLEACVADLKEDRPAAALAEEALGNARGHLEALEELNAEISKVGASWIKQ